MYLIYLSNEKLYHYNPHLHANNFFSSVQEVNEIFEKKSYRRTSDPDPLGCHTISSFHSDCLHIDITILFSTDSVVRCELEGPDHWSILYKYDLE